MRRITDEYIYNVEIWHPIGLSQNYIFKETEIHPVYEACFYVQVDSLELSRSRATVVTNHPKIAIGQEKKFDAHKGVYWAEVWLPVELSTIEEYQILLRIGKALGVKDSMPLLRKN
jgi:hypothetical protein